MPALSEPPDPRVHAIVLAAGGARRFGAAKQLAPLRGRPLLEHALAAAAAAPELAGVVVVLGAEADRIAGAVDLHGARPVVAPDWEEGIAASLRAGLDAIGPDADAALVLLGDQPEIDVDAIARVVGAWRDPGGDEPARPSRPRAVRAVHGGRPGHPVLLDRALFPALRELRGDRGAGAVLAAAELVEVECGPGAVLDVDTPDDLARAGSDESVSRAPTRRAR
ncbi:nucleotidyltransferase family protein [Conexibacter arvalis]|uniref:CTP:molybdopterin cytidylyltransferase MocA n=1 Tax=Conexibacter arvalis TaxID=912552 RepID=A0A840IBP8_9ACTN|nr:nucleotidyltransferase family protein [Conexibacter arvalis]MBB4662256.1 CTP:molybdopterin cytidylyltransferase MocA [Conexibacter arvalis]